MPLRLAFLGCGFATRLHSRTLRRFRDVERFYASRDVGRAEEYRRRYRGAGSYGSYEAALADPAIDIVLIATPPASHLELTVAALRSGKHVIVEKPPYLRSTDFDEVERVQAETGRRVFVAENYFYKPLLDALREVVRSGVIGEVRVVAINALKRQRTEDWRDRTELAGGGALYEGGIHWVSFLANLGLTVRGVSAYRPGAAEGMEKTAVVVFEYEEGAVGTLLYSWEIDSPLKGLRLSALYGSEGTVTFESNGLLLMVRGRRKRLSIPSLRDLLGYGAMFEDFFDAVRTGRAPRFDLAAARRDLELVEQAYRSLDRGAGSAPGARPGA